MFRRDWISRDGLELRDAGRRRSGRASRLKACAGSPPPRTARSLPGWVGDRGDHITRCGLASRSASGGAVIDLGTTRPSSRLHRSPTSTFRWSSRTTTPPCEFLPVPPSASPPSRRSTAAKYARQTLDAGLHHRCATSGRTDYCAPACATRINAGIAVVPRMLNRQPRHRLRPAATPTRRPIRPRRSPRRASAGGLQAAPAECRASVLYQISTGRRLKCRPVVRVLSRSRPGPDVRSLRSRRWTPSSSSSHSWQPQVSAHCHGDAASPRPPREDRHRRRVELDRARHLPPGRHPARDEVQGDLSGATLFAASGWARRRTTIRPPSPPRRGGGGAMTRRCSARHEGRRQCCVRPDSAVEPNGLDAA